MQHAKFILLTTFIALLAATWQAGAQADGLYSLRGKKALSDMSDTPSAAGVILPTKGVHDRSYKGQPPQVPHLVKAKRISLKKNQCLECHGDQVFEEAETTKVHDSHYVNRAGEKLGKISTRFYFCTQCHAQQSDRAPLVANTFRR